MLEQLQHIPITYFGVQEAAELITLAAVGGITVKLVDALRG